MAKKPSRATMATKRRPKVAPKRSPTAASKRAVSPIPADYPRVSTYLIAPDAARVIEFAKKVLGAKERGRLADPTGKIMHAEVQIGDSVVMFSEACEAFPAMPAMLSVFVKDVDTTYAAALAAGATAVRPPADQFYGDRSGGVKDHAGNQWWFASRIEDLSFAEIGRRAAAMRK
jgi:PhnB protein